MRDKLAALLWGDRGEDQARDSLRHTLVDLRKVLPAGLIAEGRSLALDPAAVDVDVVAFANQATVGTPEALDQAATLYRGDFLDGFVLREPAFEEWLVTERTRLRELAVDVFVRLLTQQRAAGRTAEAIQTAVRLLGLDPTQETAHRLLMRLYVQQGRRGAALRQYQTCVAVVRRELGAAPEPETRALYLELLQQEPERAEPAPAARPAQRETPLAVTAPDISVTDTPLIGRTRELQRLSDAWDEARQGRALLGVIVGRGGYRQEPAHRGSGARRPRRQAARCCSADRTRASACRSARGWMRCGRAGWSARARPRWPRPCAASSRGCSRSSARRAAHRRGPTSTFDSSRRWPRCSGRSPSARRC